jgi:hypothetical protein
VLVLRTVVVAGNPLAFDRHICRADVVAELVLTGILPQEPV